MKKALFIKDGFIDGQLVYECGKTYDLDEKSGSYDRWVRRGIAVDAVEEEKQMIETKEEKVQTSPQDHAKKDATPHNPSSGRRGRGRQHQHSSHDMDHDL